MLFAIEMSWVCQLKGGVDRFGRSRQNVVDSYSGQGSQTATRQKTMILDERFYILPKTLEDRKERRVTACDKDEGLII